MSTALAILAHALRMLVFEPRATLRVLMPAVLVVMGCSIAIALLAPKTVKMLQTVSGATPTRVPDVGLFLICGAIGLMGYALMAVLWHRHVLLNGAESRENLRPTGRIFFAYLWRAIIVGCAQLIAAVPITLVMGVVGATFMMNSPNGMVAGVVGLLGSMIFIWLALRLSVVLPAAAMGQTMPLRDSWTATKNIAGELWGVAALLTGLNIFVYFISGMILPSAGATAVIAQTLIFIVEGLVFISVLTTLYGHLIEGRSLGQ